MEGSEMMHDANDRPSKRIEFTLGEVNIDAVAALLGVEVEDDGRGGRRLSERVIEGSGYHWEDVPIDDPEYDVDWCAQKLVRDQPED
jgi:hypothetical protein